MVRRPRIKPPVTLPQRAEYDGRAGQSIRSILSEQPSFGFLRFAAGDIGWQYGGHVEEWRRCFSTHLEACISQYMNRPEDVPEELRRRLQDAGVALKCENNPDALSGIWKALAVSGVNVRKLPHLSMPGVQCYRLPFGLRMFVSADNRLSPASAAREYAHGYFIAQREWFYYVIIGADGGRERSTK